MKNIIVSVFSLFLIVIISCSDNESHTIEGNNYIYSNDTMLVQLNTKVISIYINNQVVYQKIAFPLCKGEYPSVNYTIYDYPDTIEITCNFNDYDNFTATVEKAVFYGKSYSAYYKNKLLTLPKTMTFTKNNTTLDINGDGILDSSQDL